MHITNQKLGFDIFKVGKLQNVFMEHDLYYNPKSEKVGTVWKTQIKKESSDF